MVHSVTYPLKEFPRIMMKMPSMVKIDRARITQESEIGVEEERSYCSCH
jgi:hypothetical protein